MNEPAVQLLAHGTTPTPAPPPSARWWWRGEVLVALLGFVGFCALILSHATALLEPDDYAYRASIVALSQGHILLSNSQYHALISYLAAHGMSGIAQWHHMASGKWISEKNPGYPFFAVLFYMAGVLRFAPLFYGALACVGLYLGARAWLGRWAGTYAVWAYCFSGAALVFAWRATMPSFTDASLIAAGTGGLLWVALETNVRVRWRLLVGLLSFLALEGAVFIRYTDVVELIVAILAVIVFFRRARFSMAMLATWFTSVVVFGLFDLAFNAWAYSSPTSTGYDPGEITFSLSALWPNLKLMPGQLARSMPVWIVAAIAVIWIVARWVQHRRATSPARGKAGRDLAIAIVLVVGWLAMWFLYFNYTWTAQMAGHGPGGSVTVHLIRFYLPTLGLIALLAAWLLSKLAAGFSWSVLAVLLVAGLFSFYSMAGSGIGPGSSGPLHGGSPSGYLPGGGSGGRSSGDPPGGGLGHDHAPSRSKTR
ncbi:MAG: hypothetical protein WA580_06935 [Acidimicrobiales bacterium]